MSKNNMGNIDDELADFLLAWDPDNPDIEIVDENGELITGERRKKIMEFIKDQVLNSRLRYDA
ncbi:hypothetical protein TAGGR_1706 [Thermodesulfovibrio aggregans]|uniref:Uncharacterized protein n=1 Tax=Thermodesulfovibrio aggregans TaxID=86166 RepID=A0A0U9HS04_9BACT|nr:hypothetical protein [Thermodesulfovibrio aggregans]GAQ94522.1 hypothetical protein TAGGR_1706 [Thermodesulfovibrio aggregans]